MKTIWLLMVCMAWGGTGCAWFRPPEPTGYPHASDYPMGSPLLASPVSGLPTEAVSEDRNRALNRFKEDFGGSRGSR